MKKYLLLLAALTAAGQAQAFGENGRWSSGWGQGISEYWSRGSPHHATWRISKGLHSDGGLTPPITGLSYPETHAFPRGAEQSRFPLMPLRHF